MAGQGVLITGGRGGIGSALARHLTARGDSVVLFGRRYEPLQLLAEELGDRAVAVPGDAGNSNDLRRAVVHALDRFGRLDGLAHCVGSIRLKALDLTTPEEFADTIHVNLTMAFLACRAVLGVFRRQGSGSVVLVSTVAVRHALSHHEIIAAAKGTVEGMVRSAAITYARQGIRFNAVAPALVETPLAAPLLRTEAARAFSAMMHPFGGGRSERIAMKIVVIGGSGLIGKKVVVNLRQHGHEVVAASPSSGVNTVTGEGLAQALAGAQVVADVANAPSWEDSAVLAFFETSGRNLLAAEADAGIGHHVALSVVGTDRLLASGYFRAKMAQEELIKASPIPYTIVRATQFFEFVGGIAHSATEGQTVRLPPVLMQPIAADDVAAVVADAALAEPLNGTFDLAGPEPICQDDLVRQFLNATGDARTVITDPKALYFGIEVNDQSLTPGDHPRLGPTRFEDWLSHNAEPGAAPDTGRT